MKIPYIKIYTADLLAKTRRLSAQEIGEAVIAACELAFEGSTDYEQCLSNASDNAKAFFNMLKEWTEDSKEALKVQRERAGFLFAAALRHGHTPGAVAHPVGVLDIRLMAVRAR